METLLLGVGILLLCIGFFSLCLAVFCIVNAFKNPEFIPGVLMSVITTLISMIMGIGLMILRNSELI